MSLHNNIELADEQPIRKCLTLTYSKMTNMLLCLYIVGDKNIILPAKGLIIAS